MENLIINNADENQQRITVEPLFKNCKRESTFIYRYKSQKMNLFLNVIMYVSRNCQVFTEQTSGVSAFLSSTCPLKYILNCGQRFSYFSPDYPASGQSVAGVGTNHTCVANVNSRR
jgi:hypothetical protein